MFWLIGATDSHPKKFSGFLGREDGFQDAASAMPGRRDLASTPCRFRRNKFKLAMSVGKSHPSGVRDHVAPFYANRRDASVANSLVQAILDDLAASALKTIDAVIETLPAGFPGAAADSVKRGVSQRLRLLDAGTVAEDIAPSIAASLLIAIDQILVCQANPSASSQTRFQKLSSLIVLFRFFSRFCHRSVWQARSSSSHVAAPSAVLRGPLPFQRPSNATTDERNDDMKPTKFTNEAKLKALFDYAVRAIGFYEA